MTTKGNYCIMIRVPMIGNTTMLRKRERDKERERDMADRQQRNQSLNSRLQALQHHALQVFRLTAQPCSSSGL